jgi:polar amino acid transport system substrate-binding protein
MPVANRVAFGFAITLAYGTFVPAKADLMKELAPTGKLRVAIAVAPAPSALYAIKDEATGQYRGVTVELGSAIAKKLGVPVEFVPHLASGEIQNSADAIDGMSLLCRLTRTKKIRRLRQCLSPVAKHLPCGARREARENRGLNESGVRVGGVANTATLRPRPRRPLSQCRVSTPPSPL